MEPNRKNLCKEIAQLHGNVVSSARMAAGDAVKAGVRLHQLKEIVGHGNFLDTLAKDLKGLTSRCATNYMRIAQDRLVEHRARALLAGGKPAMGKSENVSDLEKAQQNGTFDPPKSEILADPDRLAAAEAGLIPLPENAIPEVCWDQARAEVQEMTWLNLRVKPDELIEGIRGKDLSELYRASGIIREKEAKVYHPRKELTPDQIIEAENARAESLVSDPEQALKILLSDLQSPKSATATRVAPARWKAFLRVSVAVNKAVRALAKRKLSPAEKAAERKVENKQKAAALLSAVESCQAALARTAVPAPAFHSAIRPLTRPAQSV